MSTNIHFHPLDGSARIAAHLPHPTASHVTVPLPCPHCAASPLRLAGVKGTRVQGHDTIAESAGCVGCGRVLGRLVVTVSTIFGVEEDDAVLNGRCRVY